MKENEKNVSCNVMKRIYQKETLNGLSFIDTKKKD